MLSTSLFSHDNNVVTTLFNHQYCYNLFTRLSNNDNNSEKACSINIGFFCSNKREETGTKLKMVVYEKKSDAFCHLFTLRFTVEHIYLHGIKHLSKCLLSLIKTRT